MSFREDAQPAPVVAGASDDDEEDDEQQQEVEQPEQHGAAGGRSGSSDAGWQSEDASEGDREGDAGAHGPHQQRLEHAEEQEEEEQEGGGSSVVCVTGDYAIQNVILQMGLRLCAPDGMRITRTRRWALRCTACSQVSKVRWIQTPLSSKLQAEAEVVRRCPLDRKVCKFSIQC